MKSDGKKPTETQDAVVKPAVPPAAEPGKQQPATIRYFDRPDCAETFADSITNLSFDGQSLRIEFGITRLDAVSPGTAMTGRRYPACRLVLPPAAAIDLINKMQQTATALVQAGIVKANPAKTETP